MIYEFKIAWRTIRKEGLGSLFRKIFSYFQQIFRAIHFYTLRRPHGADPEKIVAFSFDTAGPLIGPSQLRSEVLPLVTQLKQRAPRVVVEIGTANGGTLSLWCAAVDPQAVIVSIDLPGGIHGGGYPKWKTLLYQRFAQPGQTLHLLRVDSHATATRDHLKSLLPSGGIDFLFIDGDHTYEGVKKDFEMYSPLVRQGGLVVFHDVCIHAPEADCHVDRFWAEIRTKHKSWEYIENPKQGIYGIGVLEL